LPGRASAGKGWDSAAADIATSSGTDKTDRRIESDLPHGLRQEVVTQPV
jgi:hypothetical protein